MWKSIRYMAHAPRPSWHEPCHLLGLQDYLLLSKIRMAILRVYFSLGEWWPTKLISQRLSKDSANIVMWPSRILTKVWGRYLKPWSDLTSEAGDYNWWVHLVATVLISTTACAGAFEIVWLYFFPEWVFVNQKKGQTWQTLCKQCICIYIYIHMYIYKHM